jgi:hypothetical protein
VCQHPEAAAISTALAQHTPVRELQRRYGVTKSAINRHAQNCIPISVQMARAAIHSEPVLHQMRDLNRRTLRILQKAEATDDHAMALAAIKEARNNLQLIGKLTGELDARAEGENTTGLVVNVIYAERTPPALAPPAAILDRVALPEPE